MVYLMSVILLFNHSFSKPSRKIVINKETINISAQGLQNASVKK